MQNTRNFINVSLFALTLTLLFTSCPDSPAPDAKPANQPIDRTISVKDDFISFNNGTNNKYYNLGNNPGDITVTDAEHQALYVVSTNPSFRTDTAISTFTISRPSARNAGSLSSQIEGTHNPVPFNDPIKHYSLDKRTSSLARAAGYNPPTYTPRNFSDTEKFWVPTKLDNGEERVWDQNAWTQITTLKKGESDHSLVYCDKSYLSTFTDDELQTVADQFEALFVKVTKIIGEKCKGVPSDLSDYFITPQDKIVILIHDIDNDYSITKKTNSGTFGLFWGKDMYTPNYSDDLVWFTDGLFASNQAEMFYIDSYFLKSAPAQTYSTLAHEFQHMLNMVNKVLVTRTETAAWYNEMLSMLTEDVLIKHFEDAATENKAISYNRVWDSPMGRLQVFNQYYYSSGCADFNTAAPYYANYATLYAFGAFLLRNYGGVELLHAMASNHVNNEASITAALRQCNPGLDIDFYTAYKEFVFSLCQELSKIKYWTKTVKSNNPDYEDFVLYPVDIWSDDYRPYPDADWRGPVSVAPIGKQFYRPWGFLLWLGAFDNQTVSIDFTTYLSPSEEIYLVTEDWSSY